MKQLSSVKKRKFALSLKTYRKKFLVGKYSEVDESATRLMINSFLTDVLGFKSLDEVKTEYMIRGTYADYIIQMKGKRYFIVEVKAMPIDLSEKHLRQAVNYAANEGIEWALLTNGRNFDFYKILFNKPIESQLVFSFDLSDEAQARRAIESFQFLTRGLISNRGLEALWQKSSALNLANLSELLLSKTILNSLAKQLKKTCKHKFENSDISTALLKLFTEHVEIDNLIKEKKKRKKRRTKKASTSDSPTTPPATV